MSSCRPVPKTALALAAALAIFYNQAGATFIRQFSDAATNIGSYWLTACVNAGRPALPG